MKKAIMVSFVLLLGLTSVLVSKTASAHEVIRYVTISAEEIKMIGVITRLDITGNDAKTAMVVLKDNKSGEEIEIIVNDDLTLDKFKDHRIVEGDEIRCKYVIQDGKKVATYFRKTAGC